MSASLISKCISKLKVRQYYLIYWTSEGKLIKLKDQTLMVQFMIRLERKSLNFVPISPRRGKNQVILLGRSQALSPSAHTSGS